MGVVEEAAGDMDQEHGMRNTKICSPCYKRWSSISYNRTASKAEGFFLRFCLLQKLKENIVVNKLNTNCCTCLQSVVFKSIYYV